MNIQKQIYNRVVSSAKEVFLINDNNWEKDFGED